MGLDMYLRARTYLAGHAHRSDEQRSQYEQLVDLFEMEDFVTDKSPHAYVELNVGYWRKAWDIHNWLVTHVQDGVDECQITHVSREQLGELREACLRVLANDLGHTSRPLAVMPADPEQAEWYANDLRATVALIDRLLALPSHWKFQYQSSW